jgi:hypothetical protein
VIWLKVLLALVVALLTAAVMCLLIQGLVTGGEKAVGWLVRRARARRTWTRTQNWTPRSTRWWLT